MPRSALARTLGPSATVFSALGDETRLHVVRLLCEEGPQSITRLAEGTEVTRQAVSKHLRVLEGAGLVAAEREGRECVWRLEPKGLAQSRQFLDLISREWDNTLERLRAHLEDE